MRQDDALKAIKDEYYRSRWELDYPEFRNYHEGISVIREEFEELWDEIKMNPKYRKEHKIKKEATQLGAMVLAFLTELT